MNLHRVEYGGTGERACPYCRRFGLAFQNEDMGGGDLYRCCACDRFVPHVPATVGGREMCGFALSKRGPDEFWPCKVDTSQIEIPWGVG